METHSVTEDLLAAKALVRAGRKDEARKQLTALQAVGEDFPGKTEIPDLLKQT